MDSGIDPDPLRFGARVEVLGLFPRRRGRGEPERFAPESVSTNKRSEAVGFCCYTTHFK